MKIYDICLSCSLFFKAFLYSMEPVLADATALVSGRVPWGRDPNPEPKAGPDH